MTRTLETVVAREPTQQPDSRVAKLEARLRELQHELAAQEKLAAADREIETLKEAALQARRTAASFA
jgi:hypothetical protein